MTSELEEQLAAAMRECQRWTGQPEYPAKDRKRKEIMRKIEATRELATVETVDVKSKELTLNLTDEQFSNIKESISAWQVNDPAATIEQIIVGLCDLGRLLINRRKA